MLSHRKLLFFPKKFHLITGNSRSISSIFHPNFEIITSPPERCHPSIPDNLAVLLFGFAGSSMKQLEKHSKLYNNLGYKTLSCILPQQYIFRFDVPNIVKCSQQVINLNVKLFAFVNAKINLLSPSCNLLTAVTL